MWLFNFKFSLVLSLFSRSLIAFVILVVLLKCMLIKFLWTCLRLTEVITISSKCSEVNFLFTLRFLSLAYLIKSCLL